MNSLTCTFDAPDLYLDSSQIFRSSNRRDGQKIMDSIESLRDYLIADEIRRIQSLTRDELERELIELRSGEIEATPDEELLKKIWNHEN